MVQNAFVQRPVPAKVIIIILVGVLYWLGNTEPLPDPLSLTLL